MNEISKALNVAPAEPKQEILPARTTNEQDVQYAKGNIKTILQHGMDALEDIAQVAKESQDPKAISALSQYMKTLADINQTLTNIGIPNKDNNGTLPQTNIQQQNIMMLDPAELMKQITQKKAV